MNRCDNCCWYNDRYGNCDCPRVMRARECEKAQGRKTAK